MSDEGASSARAFRETLDREAALLQSAVAFVADGHAPSTTVVGLRLCEAVIEVVRPEAQARGVRLEPLWTADEAGCDVRVRRDEAT